jgi:hypothetical protein
MADYHIGLKRFIAISLIALLGNSCADDSTKHYPCRIPKFSQEELKWVSFGFNEPLVYLNNSGDTIPFEIIARDTQCDCSEGDRSIEVGGTKYRYNTNTADLKFRIDSLDFLIYITKDSAEIYQHIPLILTLKFHEGSISILPSTNSFKDTVIRYGNGTASAMLYSVRDVGSRLRDTNVNEIALSSDHGILWITFNTGRKWINQKVRS